MCVGTSGFSYAHWGKGVFYPPHLSRDKWLEFYSSVFDTVEINFTFYRLPSKNTLSNWYNRTPADFVFTLKGSRFITHVKRLRDCSDAVELLLNRAELLDEKLEVVLWQVPPDFQVDVEVLDDFCSMLQQGRRKGLRHSFEFRHGSWFNPQVYEVLKKHGMALCIADSSRWQKRDIITADYLYLRFHGRPTYRSSYPDDILLSVARRIKRWRKRGLDTYTYFNNDANGYAVFNARTISKLVGGQSWSSH